MASGSTPLEIYIYRVLFPDGFRDLVCVVPPEMGFARGLPGEVIVGTLLGRIDGAEDDAGELTPENFAVNPVVRELFHDVIRRYAPDEPGIDEEARRMGKGYVYVIDRRTPDPGGRVPPEDIVGGFEVRAGAIVRDAYVPNPHYLFVGQNGLFAVSGWVGERLLEEIARRTGMRDSGAQA